MAFEYWLRGDVPPGPIRATVITDTKRIADILRQFKESSLILIGTNIRNIEKLINDNAIEKIVELSKIINAPIVSSDAEVIQRLSNTRFTNYSVEFPLEVIRKLARKNHNYKLIVLVGLRYTYAWLLLNHLKHYRSDLNTLSLDPYVQPNATWTLPSLPLQIWFKNLVQIIEILKSSIT